MIKITLNTENSAFEDTSEVSRILNKLAQDLEEGKLPLKLRDINGNTVGFVEYKEDDES